MQKTPFNKFETHIFRNLLPLTHFKKEFHEIKSSKSTYCLNLEWVKEKTYQGKRGGFGEERVNSKKVLPKLEITEY